MSFHHPFISEPIFDDAQPELRQLLERGVEPLKQWVREAVVPDHPMTWFSTSDIWRENLLARYLSAFLPRQPPVGYYGQEVIVIHNPQHRQNGFYNRIFTQRSGSCLIPDDFYQFLRELAHTFGDRRVYAYELVSWFEHGKDPELIWQERRIQQNSRLLHSIAHVEAHLGGTIDRSTLLVLRESDTPEWMGMVASPHEDHEEHHAVYVHGEHILHFDRSLGMELAKWFDEMCKRGYITCEEDEDR